MNRHPDIAVSIFSREAIRLWLATLEHQIDPAHFDPALSKRIDGCLSMLEAEGTP